MAKIIPYDEKILDSNGAYITFDGEIIYVDKNHEETALEYCNNSLFEGHLNLDQLDTYKMWCNEDRPLSDYMLFVLSMDKIIILSDERAKISIPKTIITPNRNPHIRFYNYYLMDFYINHVNKMKYNIDSQKFEEEYDFYYDSFADGEAKEELDNIKRMTLRKDRNLFFRK